MVDEWGFPWEGGCRCGRVRLRVTRAPLVTMACDCRGCQRMRGSAFSPSAAIPAEGFAVIAGEPVIGGLRAARRWRSTSARRAPIRRSLRPAADGLIVGFDIDIGQALCAEMGETCTLVKVDWDGMIPALVEKKCDAIVASMSATDERRQVIDFSDKYYNVPNRFVGRSETGLTEP
jgi:ABC-type amino acid transport substrate-binding protein